MNPIRIVALGCALLSTPLLADGPADNRADQVRPVPPPGVELSAGLREELERGVRDLGIAIEQARQDLKNRPALLALLPDVVIFHNAVRYAVEHNEIFNPTNEVPAARAALQNGHERLENLKRGNAPWLNATGLVVRGYISKIDDSVQPYGLVVPMGVAATPQTPRRLDVWFHGRDEKLSELNFLAQRQRSPGEFTPRDAFVLHTYGRFCNGQKFAGETDVLEALEHVRRSYAVDENRLVVRGFSLGGAACWHMAVHYPGMWAAAAPGAGFSETADFLKVFQNEAVSPPWYEQKLWHMYDCTDYALNLFNLPTVAYSGEIDRQKQAADVMEKAAQREGLDLVHIIGPQTAHKYHPEAKEEINRRIDGIAAVGRNPLPRSVRFATWTLRYNSMAWVTVDRLQKHWEEARVLADLEETNVIRIRTTNVTALTVNMPAGLCPFDISQPVLLLVNGQTVTAGRPGTDRSFKAAIHLEGKGWKLGAPPAGSLVKSHGLQGPIDDAFMDSFLVVRPTGKAINPVVGAWVEKEMARATNEWRRHFRGEARVKDDRDVTEADMQRHHLILWGDPQSNALIGKWAGKLPLKWSAESVTIGPATLPAASHVPVLIYPNPAQPGRYIVLNSGFTFREYDYLNNARQVSKLPDYAILNLETAPGYRYAGAVKEAGFFGENWEWVERGNAGGVAP